MAQSWLGQKGQRFKRSGLKIVEGEMRRLWKNSLDKVRCFVVKGLMMFE